MTHPLLDILVPIGIIVYFLGMLLFLDWNDNHWTEWNEWYDINGRGSVRLNVGRMFRSQKWKDDMEKWNKVSEEIKKNGSVTILD